MVEEKNLEAERDARCFPVAQAILEGMAKNLLEEDGVKKTSLGALELTLQQDLNIVTDMSYIPQLILNALSGVNATVQVCDVNPLDEVKYNNALNLSFIPEKTNATSSFLNPTLIFDILENDFTDCSDIDYSSAELIDIEDYTFPDCYTDGTGFLNIIPNQASYIPGEYKIGYTIKNINNIQSNTASINLTISEDEFLLYNITNDKLCLNSTSSVPISFTISGGTPVYSWSKDGVNYNPISGFLSPKTISTSSSPFPTLYIKDYVGKIITSSIDFYNPNIEFNYIINNPTSCDLLLSGTLEIESNQAVSYSLDSNPTLYNISSSILIPTGSHTLILYDIYGCSTSSLFDIEVLPLFNYEISSSQPTCYNINNGILDIKYLDENPESVTITIEHPTSGTLIYPTSSLIITNIGSGEIYGVSIDNNICIVSQSIEYDILDEVTLTLSNFGWCVLWD